MTPYGELPCIGVHCATRSSLTPRSNSGSLVFVLREPDFRSVLRVVIALLGLGCVIVPAVARADEPSHRAMLGVSAEGFFARNLDTAGSGLFGVGFGGALDLEVNLHALVGLTAGVSAVDFTASASPQGAIWLGGRAGVRFHWGVLMGGNDDGWLDAHWNFGASGEVSRGGFDLGLAYAFSITRGLRIGPIVRYQWSSDPAGTSPTWLEGGVTVVVLGDPRYVDPSLDVDEDGVLNDEDVCPSEPAGVNPDPARAGCAMRDQDGDGVFDAQDECPTVPAGARPDAARAGCPASDADSDGVGDAQDVCPTTPAGANADPARAGCPNVDSDGDGIPDAQDACPTEPPGPRADAARPGCPMADRDRDTVPDNVDHCPDAVGAPSQDPARNGCPGLVRVDEQQIHILRPVYFGNGRDVILEDSFPVLAAVADAILAGGLSRIRVEGHTDDRGDSGRNQALSQRRAESVRRWLMEHGVPGANIVGVGYGDTRPIEPNEAELGRAANRRVEFHIGGE